jgi:hypothetical protein
MQPSPLTQNIRHGHVIISPPGCRQFDNADATFRRALSRSAVAIGLTVDVVGWSPERRLLHVTSVGTGKPEVGLPMSIPGETRNFHQTDCSMINQRTLSSVVVAES